VTIRAYTPADFDTVAAWAKARDMALVPQLLSPNGFLVEDDDGPIAACWVYLTLDCPRASIDDFYARPNACAWKIKQAWQSMERAVFGFLSNLRDCNGDSVRYSVLSTFADSKLSEFLRSEGWHVGQKSHYHIIKAVPYATN
jgi:hypothetical protein